MKKLTYIEGLWTGMFATALLALVSAERMNQSRRKQIAERGCAHFYLDANNDLQWNWKECK